MKKYNILVDFGAKGCNEQGSIFTVIRLILKESAHARVTVTKL